ncbi:MAG: hypothetical protein AB1578_15005 [Thermodesulfobacteriota bacterium]
MPHYCHVCGQDRPNEKFSGKGHRRHVCKDCARLPKAERERRQLLDDLWGYWFQSNLSEKNRKHLGALREHPDAEIRAMAAVLHQVALVHPRKRRRLKRLRGEHPDLWAQLAALGFAEEDSACEDGGAWRTENFPWEEPGFDFRDDEEDPDAIPF